MPESFKSNPSLLRELFLKPGLGFYVPVYQREFTWGEDEIDRLFEDVENGISRYAEGQNPSTFLGSVIFFSDREAVSPKQIDALPTDVLHVVDGQQRLTTLLITFSILSRFISERMIQLNALINAGPTLPLHTWLLNNLGDQQKELLDALSLETYSGTGEYKHKPRLIRQASDTWGNDATRAVYASDVAWFLMETTRMRLAGKSDQPVAASLQRAHLNEIVRKITEHIAMMSEESSSCPTLNDLTFLANTGEASSFVGSCTDAVSVPSSLDDNTKAAARLLILSSFLLKGVLVIEVRAPSEDYAFALFEPLNTTGQLLNAIETLKPLVVQSEGGVTTYTGTQSEVAFSRIEAHLPTSLKAEERARKTSELLIAFALAETGTQIARTLASQRQYLRKEFNSLSDGDIGDISQTRDFVRHIAETADFISDVWNEPKSPLISGGSDLDQLCIEVLRSTKHTIVIPILARFYDQWKQNPTDHNRDEFLSALRAITAFWTLWRTSRTTTKGIDDVHRRLMLSGDTVTGLPALAWRSTPASTSLATARDIKKALRNILTTRADVAKAGDWVSKVTIQPLYSTNQQLAKFVLLAAHEDRIQDPTKPGLVRRGVAAAFPCLNKRSWEANYSVEHIAPQNPGSGDRSYEGAIYDAGLVDRLGNLTLMPTDLNSLLGNRNWPLKRGIYEALALVSVSARTTSLKASIPGLAPTTLVIIQSGEYLPFCEFISDASPTTLTANFIIERGQRLAELAFAKLWPMLN